MEFATDQPAARPVSGDPRELSLSVGNVVIAVDAARRGGEALSRAPRFWVRGGLGEHPYTCGSWPGIPWFSNLFSHSQLLAENARLRAEGGQVGRLSSPGPFLFRRCTPEEEVAEAMARGGFGPPFGGVDLNEAGQQALLEKLAGYYPAQPFPEEPAAGLFHFNNPSYGHFDAIMLYSMMCHLQPKRIVEVGSGFNSAAMLDVNQHVLGGRTQPTFIDPDLSRLNVLLQPGDGTRATVIEKRVQEVPLFITELGPTTSCSSTPRT